MVVLLRPESIEALAEGTGRGFTVLCLLQDEELLARLAAIGGPTALVLAAGQEPAAGTIWSAVRCDPAQAIPLRSHVVDAALLVESAGLAEIAAEIRRVLAPGGDVRVLLTGAGDADDACQSASIRPRARAAGVLICRGP